MENKAQWATKVNLVIPANQVMSVIEAFLASAVNQECLVKMESVPEATLVTKVKRVQLALQVKVAKKEVKENLRSSISVM